MKKEKINKVYYNKLIRDNIPLKMDNLGVRYETKTLNFRRFKKELIRKVLEESSALTKEKDKKGIVDELADVLDVIDEIKKVFRIKSEEIRNMQRINSQKKGGFKKKIFLIWSEANDDYKTNERRGKK